VCASGAQSSAGGVEREEVGGVEAGEYERRLCGDAAEAGDAAAEVDGGDDRLAAGRGGHVGRAEEGYLGGEVGGLARALRVGPRRRSADEAEQQQKRNEWVLWALHGCDISRSPPTLGFERSVEWRVLEGMLWMEPMGGSGQEGVAYISGVEAPMCAVPRATRGRKGWGWVCGVRVVCRVGWA
jgi:hypothetical protein